MSSLVLIFKGKGDPLNPNSFKGIKLLKYAFKTYEKVLDGRLREVVDIDKMQCGFTTGRRTVDAVLTNDRVLTDAFCDKMGVVVKMEDMIIQSHLRWYVHIMRGNINPQICGDTEVEITEKKKKGRPRKSWEECIKKNLEQHGLGRDDAYN